MGVNDLLPINAAHWYTNQRSVANVDAMKT